MNYYIKIYSNKPKEDINNIVETIGYKSVGPDIKKTGGLAHFLIKSLVLLSILWRVRRGDMLLIQYPYKKFFKLSCQLAHMKGGKVVTLIHDLGSFRRKKLTVEGENKLLMHSDYLICHNASMHKFLVEHGYTNPIDDLEIFDYLSSVEPADYQTPHKPWQLVYAGGLGYKRNPFLYALDDKIEGWKLELFGKEFEEERSKGWKNIHFNGLLTPEELARRAEGDFGLVWDGESMDECSGAWGEYLKINNPHKTSFTLRIGLPVVIWKRAAMAPFIEQNKVGICVDSLLDLNNVLANLTPETYAQMRSNAKQMSRRLAEGYYTRQALLKAEKTLGVGE